MAMEITGLIGSLKGYGRVDRPEPATRKDKGSRPSSGQGDSVSLSGEAKLFGSAMSAAQQTPEVRRQKVEDLKALVESGQYQPDIRKTAAKLVEEDLELLL
ncbi:flagellar biosynthesis anti-sigma factor FlgM [Desulfocurvus vexinensis]|uniref:flagellar biosynthesis anti-sigma factor FlgM n=1 Tax=Desulfocurvus vexinensis TaxID=399548 RepID=UPI0004B82A6A|nr:flagellar biosynthesis anti-sigma factor FlgM [Desulfocurvus vexinensis]